MRKLSLAFLAGTALVGWGTTAALASSSIVLQYSNVIATGSTIFLNRLPILLPTGKFIFKDVTIQLQADDSGVVSDISPIVQKLSAALPFTFKAGIYELASSTAYGFALSGPSPVPGSVMAKWETNVTPGKSQSCGAPAIFYVGPLSSHPSAARLKAAGITSTEYSYGIIANDASCGSDGGAWWGPGALVGFSQSGPNLTVASFTAANRTDSNIPKGFFTFRTKLP